MEEEEQAVVMLELQHRQPQQQRLGEPWAERGGAVPAATDASFTMDAP